MRRRETQIESEIAARDMGLVAIIDKLERPIANPHGCSVLRRVGQAKTSTPCPLVMCEPPMTRIGHGSMCEQKLARRESTGIHFCHSGPIAEERDLHTIVRAERIFDPPGDVPPLGAILWMAAMVAREAHRITRHNLRIGAVLDWLRRQQCERAREKAPPFHCCHASTREAFTSPP